MGRPRRPPHSATVRQAPRARGTAAIGQRRSARSGLVLPLLSVRSSKLLDPPRCSARVDSIDVVIGFALTVFAQREHRGELRRFYAGAQVRDTAVEAGHLGIIRLGNIHSSCLMNGYHEVEYIHRIEIDLLAQIDCRIDFGLEFGRDVLKLAQDHCLDLFVRHSFSGSCKRRSILARKRAPRCPSLAR